MSSIDDLSLSDVVLDAASDEFAATAKALAACNLEDNQDGVISLVQAPPWAPGIDRTGMSSV